MGKIKYLCIAMLLFISFVLVFYTGCAAGEDNDDAGSLEDQIRGVIQPHVKVGAMVGVIHRGSRLVFSFGNKTREGDNPPDGNTVFEIGSITKTFTGILLAHMHVSGIVNQDDPVGGYLAAPEVTMPSHNGVEITLKHLAAHLSGLPKLPPDMGPLEEYPYLTYSVQDMYDFLNGYSLTRTPGSEYLYSNIGMGLLGHTLGLIDGTNYQDLLAREIFSALGMTRSSVFLTPAQESNLAAGHDADLTVTHSWDSQDCLQGAGAIKSCLNDLFIYMEVNIGLRPSLLASAMELSHRSVFTIQSGQSTGLGWGLYEMPGQNILWHNGITAGYTSYMGFNKELANGVIILFNHFDGPSWEVGERILSILKDN